MKSLTLRLFALAAAAVLSACILPTDVDGPAPVKPDLVYGESYTDTVGLAVSHAPTVGAGSITSFRIAPDLPQGLEFDTTTGVVSGTPLDAAELSKYRVIAAGRGGSDTASFFLAVVDTSAAAAPQSVAVLSLGLKASAGFTLSRVLVEWVSSVVGDAVIRDTVVSGTSGFDASSSSDQNVLKAYTLKAARDWTLHARVLDSNDSLLYRDSARVDGLLNGETRAVPLLLEARYLRYLAKFIFPDSIRSSGTAQAEALKVRRVRLALNGRTVVDSSRMYFGPGSPGHTFMIPYVRTEVRQTIKSEVYADLSGWPLDKPAFSDSLVVTPDHDTSYATSMAWTGPGSPSDPNYNPGNPGGAKSSLAFQFRPFTQVTVEPGLDPILFKKK